MRVSVCVVALQWLTSNVQDEHAPHKDFPPPDLLEKLIDLYFKNMNDYLPLLHRPTFEQGVREGLHLRDEGFGSTVLLVCANGSRFTDDPRVLLDDNTIPQSAGWKWFQQVQMVRKSLLAPPRLYDLQIYAVRHPCPIARSPVRRRGDRGRIPSVVSSMLTAFALPYALIHVSARDLRLSMYAQLTAGFLQGTSAPQACWTIIGIGVRMAQDVGAHRKKVYSSSPTVEEELWRRAFW